MTISAKMIADSVNDAGNRLTTVQLRYPRFIHAELMTHRVFSRNASSSRAIPVARLIEDVIRDTAMPIHWGKNQKGMQADGECNEPVTLYYAHTDEDEDVPPEEAWLTARDRAITVARAFDKAGYHKQIVNRLLEPFSHINVLVSATEWDNFFELRDHPDAQPEIQQLARCIRSVMDASTPVQRRGLDYHLPYVSDEERFKFGVRIATKLSVARCARVSYLTHDGKEPSKNADIALYDRLVGSVPIHASPAEHQAHPTSGRSQSNFTGWFQHRKVIEC